MTYLNILVEGPTEEQFVNRVIQPYLKIFNIYILKTINLRGSTKYSEINRNINNLLKDPNRHVTTLFDYYGLARFSKDFPGIEIKDDKNKDITDKINHIQKKFGEDINCERFIPYIQLHEFEAFIFIDGEIAASKMLSDKRSNISSEIDTARQNNENNPELINDSPNSAPSKRLKKLYPAYDKVNDGVDITSELGITRIMEACPRFHNWIETLKKLENAK